MCEHSLKGFQSIPSYRFYLFFIYFGTHLECPQASYGRDCFQNCSENCYKSKTCDRNSGVCTGGCVEGRKPPLCNEGRCILFKTLAIFHSDFRIVFIIYQFNG